MRHVDAPSLSLVVGMASKCGPRRKNDDYCAMSQRHDFFALSDGIGGAPYGDVISRVACNAAIEAYDATNDLREAFAMANEQASRVSRYLGERSGATLLLARRTQGFLEIASAGDSLAYRLRAGSLERAMGPARVSLTSNALSKAVGYGPLTPDRARMDVRPKDRILLCSDGVWEYVEEAKLADMLAEGDDATRIADDVCRHAAKVGNDNSTCICIIVEEARLSLRSKTPHYAESLATARTPAVALVL